MFEISSLISNANKIKTKNSSKCENKNFNVFPKINADFEKLIDLNNPRLFFINSVDSSVID